MNKTALDAYRQCFQFAHKETMTVLKAVPETHRLRQLAPEKATPLWLAGHLANTVNSVILMWIFGHESLLPMEQRSLFLPDFAGGVPPLPDPERYPPWEAVLRLYEDCMHKVITELPSLEGKDLSAPIPVSLPDEVHAYFPSQEAALLRLINHDAHHRGQISLIANLP